MTRHLLALWSVAYTALTLIVTFPLVTHLSSVVPHDLGDPLLSTSILWWSGHVMPLTKKWWDGFAFFPATGTISFSDHRLGAGLLASPLQWLGFSAVTSYNVTLLVSFPLCAIAAHGLGLTLTKRHDAAAICGLAYGFNPFRMAHIEHLELLMAFGMPAALTALHLYRNTRHLKWAVFFALALVVQGLCTTYYVFFFGVLLLLWILWFDAWRDWRPTLAIVVACASAAGALSPIALGYWRIHRQYDFVRLLNEIVGYSADITSLATASPMLLFWGWTGSLNGPERQLFPGLTIVLLTVCGLVAALRGERVDRTDRRYWLVISLILMAAFFAAVAAAAVTIGPWRLSLGPVSLSVGVPYKPLSLAALALAGSVIALPQFYAAYHRRSPFVFYLIVSILLFTCSFGPKPSFRGVQVFYEPPYAWLMRLPVFTDGVRVPARFAMPAVLTLSVAAALAFNRLRMNARLRDVVLCASLVGIVADGWIGPLPLLGPPEMWTAQYAQNATAVLELPLGHGFADFVAMYRATAHGRLVVNGDSGYRPSYYETLRIAFDERDQTALDPLTEQGPLLVVVNKRADPDGRLGALARGAPRATLVGDDSRWTYFEVAPKPAARPCAASALPISSAFDNRGAVKIGNLTDHDPRTGWATPGPQRVGDMLVVDLGRSARVCSVRMSLATSPHLFPRLLRITTSEDGTTWTSTFAGKTAGLAIRGALENPREVWLDVPTQPSTARFLKFQLEAAHEVFPWFVPDLEIIGTPMSETGLTTSSPRQ